MYDLAHQFVNLVSSSLQELALCPPDRFGESQSPSTVAFSTRFNPLPNLHSLRLSLCQDTHEIAPILHFPWAMELISNLSHPQKLHELRVPYGFQDWSIDRHRLPNPTNDKNYRIQLEKRLIVGWDAFDQLLTSGSFPNLRTVHFSAFATEAEPEVNRICEPQFVSIIRRLLPKLDERGILKVTWTISEY
ncbi:hypothetical protein BDN72DRAFT_902420 [Pluteus cervinus]|uniref:Uncharacterized protein n=1 Tax=Pluteus cervinus TaxID=181527 RepID=A0ACD3ACU4_9AGAR|nr:hypothetical protein BDN72DRAFT_902420 [Pluteus cervinus]